MVTPRMAAFDEAMMVKSLPVNPSKTSMIAGVYVVCLEEQRNGCDVEEEGNADGVEVVWLAGVVFGVIELRGHELPTASERTLLDPARVAYLHKLHKIIS